MAAQTIKLSASHIGVGTKLFHVSLLADGWTNPTFWMVAANDLDEAFDLAMREYADYDRADFDDGLDGYQIGEFVI
jgi:hypothetical protein